jgi:hypothetical protein
MSHNINENYNAEDSGNGVDNEKTLICGYNHNDDVLNISTLSENSKEENPEFNVDLQRLV